MKNVCYGNAEVARTFLAQIKGQKNVDITTLVKEYVDVNKISGFSAHRTLWSILHGHGFYKASESNWNIALGKH